MPYDTARYGIICLSLGKADTMPVHDWKSAPAGYFHHFHQRWTGEICDALNAGLLPKGLFALVEQQAAGLVPDVLALEARPRAKGEEGSSGGGLAVAVEPPKTRFVSRAAEEDVYAAKANRVVIRKSVGKVVAVIEIVSPGNKHSMHALRVFVEKSLEFLEAGIHLLVVDLFPPTRRDPQGIHKAIWDEIADEPFELPPDKPLTLAAYTASVPKTAYVEPVAVGDVLPDMPVFIDSAAYVHVPLERTYEATWAKCPQEFREAVAGG